ncbi:glycosyltransferase [Brachymonas denitrificans]|uniref:glycosyltransferase n=1 Tax=Brachymonas denitrificans TaxID=28220 RepID=UPI0032200B9C
MKIVVVQPLLPRYSIAFFNRLVQLYPEISLVVLADIETRDSLNQYRKEDCLFTVRHLPSKVRSGFIFQRGLLRLLHQENADRIVFNANPRGLTQLWAMLVHRIQGKQFTAWGMFHRIGGPRLVSTLFFCLVGRLAERCLTYTRTGASNLVSLGVPKHKIGIVGTAIDERIPLAERSARTAEELAAFRREQDLEGKHIVLQVVRLSRYKRPELLIHAAEFLLQQRKDLLFVLIGNGEMREELEQMVVSRGLQDAFRFLGAIYDEAALSRWYLSASVFVVPTCIGLSAHHAMSYGVPVVTDDSLDSQASEFSILTHGLNCLTYQEGDPKDLATAIDTLISEPILRDALRKNTSLTIRFNSIDKKCSNFYSLNHAARH